MINRYPQDAAAGAANARRLRLAVAICVLLVLIWVLLDSLETTLKTTEEQGAKLRLNQIRSLLVVKGAEARLSANVTLEQLMVENPFDWFEEPPSNYEGECATGFPAPRAWCFKPLQTGNSGNKKPEQAGRAQVIFRPTQPINVEDRQGNRDNALAWVVAIEFQDRNGNERLDSGEPQTGLKLEPAGVRQASKPGQ